MNTERRSFLGMIITAVCSWIHGFLVYGQASRWHKKFYADEGIIPKAVGPVRVYDDATELSSKFIVLPIMHEGSIPLGGKLLDMETGEANWTFSEIDDNLVIVDGFLITTWSGRVVYEERKTWSYQFVAQETKAFSINVKPLLPLLRESIKA